MNLASPVTVTAVTTAATTAATTAVTMANPLAAQLAMQAVLDDNFADANPGNPRLIYRGLDRRLARQFVLDHPTVNSENGLVITYYGRRITFLYQEGLQQEQVEHLPHAEGANSNFAHFADWFSDGWVTWYPDGTGGLLLVLRDEGDEIVTDPAACICVLLRDVVPVLAELAVPPLPLAPLALPPMADA